MDEVICEPGESHVNSEVTTISKSDNIAATVTIANDQSKNEFFTPSEITVGSGTTVTWTNIDTTIHEIIEGNPNNNEDETPVFDSSIIAPGSTWEYTFNNVGEFDYYCVLHPFMTGKITIE